MLASFFEGAKRVVWVEMGKNVYRKSDPAIACGLLA